MNINIEVHVEDIADSVIMSDREDTLELIKAIDLRVADVDFTTEVVVALLESLKIDLDNREKIDEIIESVLVLE